MINILKLSLKIDFNYAINSFIYTIKKTPILKSIISSNLYEKTLFKTFIRVLGVICTSLRLLVFRGIYFMMIYYMAKWISHNTCENFLHIYFIFSIMGMFINTSILSTSRKKYISILLLNMNAKKFTLSHYLFKSILDFILNNIFLLIILTSLKASIFLALLLSLLSLFSKNIGEAISVLYYQKNKQKLLTEKMYFSIIILGLGISFLPILPIYFSSRLILIFTMISFILTIPSLIYLFKVENYKMIYKKLNTLNAVMNQEHVNQSTRQLIVDIKNKDKEISKKKLKNKKGYDLFNTIFFERHKYILLRSSKIFAILSLVLLIGMIILLFEYPHQKSFIHIFLLDHISFLVLIMYFINRGAIVTQAMFFNCDHYMLTFNFYKESKVILGLFKKRLLTLIKINLIPSIVIAIGFPLILGFTGKITLLEYSSIFIFIISTSVFFSVHYLIIYYLFQPYNQEMMIKSPTYSFINLVTYFGCYMITKIHFNPIMFCMIAILFTGLYILISLRLVYKKAPYTFKIK